MLPCESSSFRKRSSRESYTQAYASSTDARVPETAAVISGTLTGSTIPATAVTMARRPQALPLGLN